MELKITIPDNKATEYIADYVYIHPNTETNENDELIYTDAQWVKEHLLRTIKNQIIRGKNKKYKDNQETSNVDDVV